MACFTLEWFRVFLIWLAVVIFLVAIVRLLIPYLLGLFGGPPGGGIIGTILTWIIWLLIAVAVINVSFGLIECVFGGAFPSLHFRNYVAVSPSLALW